MVTVRRGAVMLAVALAGCLGRVERTDVPLTLSIHATDATLRSLPRAPVEAPAPIDVAAPVRFEPFVDYYPLPVGVSFKPAAYNSTSRWAPIVLEPSAGAAVQGWFARAVRSAPGEPQRIVRGVVSHFEWNELGFTVNAGIIASEVVVTDPDGTVRYRDVRVTRARVPFVDALFRAHVREWLGDPKFVAALQGGSR